ncbi:MAG: hypothetical protein VKK99_02140, partial [Cyanobacteriota bacterium]|nr:hypothetical protein [Cyanobacteriota bacterium]
MAAAAQVSLPVAPPPPIQPDLVAQAAPSPAAPPGDGQGGTRYDGLEGTPFGQPGTPPAGGPESSPASPSPEAMPGGAPGAGAPPLQPTPVAKPEPGPSDEPRVLLSEIVIQGLDGHPEKERIERAAYAAMAVTPGTQVTRSDLRKDLAAIYATGWFSDVRLEPVDSALGVRLLVKVVPNPVLTKVTLDPQDAKLPPTVVQDTFAADFGKTINLNTLQGRIQELQKWYADQGYSLARVTGPS